MAAQNQFKGKYKEGTFANGQGPVFGQHIKNESEEKGVLNEATSGRHIQAQGGKSETLAGEPKGKNFDLYSKEYAGTGNLAFKPSDKGEVNPFDIQ